MKRIDADELSEEELCEAEGTESVDPQSDFMLDMLDSRRALDKQIQKVLAGLTEKERAIVDRRHRRVLAAGKGRK